MPIRRLLIYSVAAIVILIVVKLAYIRIFHVYEFEEKLVNLYFDTKIKWLELITNTDELDKSVLDDSTMIGFHASECFGPCSVYSFNMYGSGRVEFKGEKFVCQTQKSLNIDKKLVKNLARKLTVIKFENYSNFNNVDITDSQTYKILFQRGDKVHSIEHYRGDLSAPKELRLVEKDILKIVDEIDVLGSYSSAGLICKANDKTEKLIPWQQLYESEKRSAIKAPEIELKFQKN